MDILQKREDILIKALVEFGTEAQTTMVFEECGELLAAMAQEKRGRNSYVIGEIADVFIILSQMRIHFGREIVDEEIERKLAKLAKRLGVQ